MAASSELPIETPQSVQWLHSSKSYPLAFENIVIETKDPATGWNRLADQFILTWAKLNASGWRRKDSQPVDNLRELLMDVARANGTNLRKRAYNLQESIRLVQSDAVQPCRLDGNWRMMDEQNRWLNGVSRQFSSQPLQLYLVDAPVHFAFQV